MHGLMGDLGASWGIFCLSSLFYCNLSTISYSRIKVSAPPSVSSNINLTDVSV